ncbi:MAG TPA: DUF6391 domain-containing protein [Ktedonobacterales bacterium]
MNPIELVVQQLTLGGAVRENHALEHATIVLLSKQYPEARLSGVSFAPGFFVFGDVPTEAVLPAAQQALGRLRGGEPEMAIHERCGTNLAVAGLLTGLSAMTVSRMRKPYNNFNNVVLATTAAIVLSRPLGLLVQRYLTTRTPGRTMHITGVKQMAVLGQPAHFVQTENEGAALFSRPAVSNRIVDASIGTA